MTKSRANEIAGMVNKELGSGTLLLGNDDRFKTEMIPTNILPVDDLLNGGIPRGRWTEVFGDYSTLKSFIGYNAIAMCQEMGGTAALIDTEHIWDAEWGEHLGVDVDELILQWPETAEMAIDVTDVLIRQGVDLIVWDSVAAMVPQAEASKREHGENANVAELARLMSRGMRKLTTANERTALLYINQTRMNIGVTFGSNETTPGGKAPGFYASHRIRCQKGGKVTETGKMWVGGGQSNTYSTTQQKVKLELHKSKLTKPHREVWMLFDMNDGRVVEEDYLFARCVQEGIVTSPSKGWYRLDGGKKKWRREDLCVHIWNDDDVFDGIAERLFPWT